MNTVQYRDEEFKALSRGLNVSRERSLVMAQNDRLWEPMPTVDKYSYSTQCDMCLLNVTIPRSLLSNVGYLGCQKRPRPIGNKLFLFIGGISTPALHCRHIFHRVYMTLDGIIM